MVAAIFQWDDLSNSSLKPNITLEFDGCFRKRLTYNKREKTVIMLNFLR